MSEFHRVPRRRTQGLGGSGAVGAHGDERSSDATQFGVRVLGGVAQHAPGLVGGEGFDGHEDPAGLIDNWAGCDGLLQLLNLLLQPLHLLCAFRSP